MSTVTTLHLNSTSSAATESLGALIGSRLKGGEVIELQSDLGGGKTTFVRGLARGMGSSDHVASPTFTVSREYHAPSLTLYHFDFYRLNEGGMVAAELADYLGDTQAVIVVEWADVIADILPAERLRVALVTTGQESRDILLEAPVALNYLVADAEKAVA